jgi:hypothetical protein
VCLIPSLYFLGVGDGVDVEADVDLDIDVDVDRWSDSTQRNARLNAMNGKQSKVDKCGPK